MTTFIHTADWHLGKPFAGVQDPVKRARIQQERIDGLRRIREAAVRRQASFVVVAGDLFDSPSPTKSLVAQALGVIGEFPMPVYAIPGNHDHGGTGSLWEQPFFISEHRQRATNLHLLLQPQPVEAGGAVILPCPLLRRHDTTDPCGWVRELDFDSAGKGPRIVLAHGSSGTFGSQADGEDVAGPANVIAVDRLPADQIDYVALGDWHGCLQVGAKAWYSGTHETDRFPKAGQRPGTVLAVTVSRGAAPTVEVVPTGRLDWLAATIDLAEDGPQRCEETLAALTQAAGFDRCLVDLALTGRASLEARRALDRVLESWALRLIRLDVRDAVALEPSPEEVRQLVERPGDPIVARVAAELVALSVGAGAEAADARAAIDILHGLCRRAAEEGA